MQLHATAQLTVNGWLTDEPINFVMRALNYSIWYINRNDSRVVYFDSLVVTNCLEQGRVLGEQSIKLVHPSASRYTDLNARYWVLPMNINQCHWNLAVYDRYAIQPVLYWLDSLSSPATSTTSDVNSLAAPFRSLPRILDYKLSAPLPVIHLPVRTQTVAPVATSPSHLQSLPLWMDGRLARVFICRHSLPRIRALHEMACLAG